LSSESEFLEEERRLMKIRHYEGFLVFKKLITKNFAENRRKSLFKWKGRRKEIKVNGLIRKS